ncbi:hypothetical protein [Novacetimonas hansenii]|uniref:Uracil DNA glycosylase superfamily protein n=1 Tax=Novacetimonas hansenii TaxID=436 RepID=A0AAW5ET18_NOVHA|nr:hypothetical protein [Novacetimonas hansenii]MCJ8354749.1 hypothetical protein [Novacetimonas hansenii]
MENIVEKTTDTENTIDKKLYHSYLDILKNYNEDLFNKKQESLEYSNLSGLFVTTSPAQWEQGKRILVVGRETRGWNVVNENKPYTDLQSYIKEAMEKQKKFLLKYIEKKKDPGFTFYNFLRDLGSHFGDGNIGWANLFCFDWKGSRPNPNSTPNYETIKELSGRLLKAAIQYMEPDIIIFANGASSANVRREFFPLSGETAVCSSPWVNYLDQKIEKIELESFVLYGKIKCYRINHPANRAKKSSKSEDVKAFLSSQQARKYLIDLIKKDIQDRE